MKYWYKRSAVQIHSFPQDYIMDINTQRLINTSNFNRCCENLAMGTNLHRGFDKQEILESLNNPEVFTNGIKVEVSEFMGGVKVKVWYSEKYYCAASC